MPQIFGYDLTAQLEVLERIVQELFTRFVSLPAIGGERMFIEPATLGPAQGFYVYEYDSEDLLVVIVDIRWWEKYDRFHFSKNVADCFKKVDDATTRAKEKTVRIFFADPYYPGEEEDIFLHGPRSLSTLRKVKDAHINHCPFLEVTPLFVLLLYGNLDPDLGYAKAQRIGQLLATEGIRKIKEVYMDFWINFPYIEVLVNQPEDYTYIKELWDEVKVERWICTRSNDIYYFEEIKLERSM